MRLSSTQRTIAALGAAGALTLTGVGAAVAATSTDPSTETTAESTEDRDGERRQAVLDALDELVADGTLTDVQAQEVADALADSEALRHGPGRDGHGPGSDGHGPGGGRGIGMDAAAEALGLSEQELRDALSDGETTLADVAGEQGVDTGALVEALTAAAEERITARVEAGDLTQERADELLAELSDRITTAVDEPRHDRSEGR